MYQIEINLGKTLTFFGKRRGSRKEVLFIALKIPSCVQWNGRNELRKHSLFDKFLR